MTISSMCKRMVLVSALLLVAGFAAGAERKAFRVCADPYSLPQSNNQEQGYENKIAELFASSLGLPVEYEWFPQRIGFIRNTLRDNNTPDGTYKCDIVMGVTDNFELAAPTRPYLHSAWAMVYAKGRGLDDIRIPQDLANLPPERKEKLRIGAFDKSPAVRWLFRNGLVDRIVPFQAMTGDPHAYPGQIIDHALAHDEIDIAFVWGPIAGYFAKQLKEPELKVVLMHTEPGIKFDYQIAMAVRFGEKEWKEQINQLIEQHQDDINAILDEYGVPRLPLELHPQADDDD